MGRTVFENPLTFPALNAELDWSHCGVVTTHSAVTAPSPYIIVKAIMALHGGEMCASCLIPALIRFELRFPAMRG
jgi:hypothetical protein